LKRDPAVSVIIPTHNYGRFLGEALESVLSQSFEDFEVTVVDDGSTDHTQEVLDGFRDPRLRRIHTRRGGNSVAINTGLDAARGELIAILDADDRWRPAKLERQVAMMRAEPELGAVFTDFARFNDGGFLPRTQFSFFPELAGVPTRPSRDGGGRVVDADAFAAFVPFGQFPAWMQTMMLRAERVRGLRYHPGIRRSADMHYMLRAYARLQAGFIPEVLAEVRRHGNNSYNTPLEKLVADAQVRRTVLEEESLATGHRAILRRRTGLAFAELGHHHFWSRSPRGALRGYLAALRYPGSRLNALQHLAVLPLVPLLPARAETDWDPAPRPETPAARPPRGRETAVGEG
jgi:glycosyltransferase involved in cell wall biosynthesis